jgi:large subunit ribosomal protein L37Ae
MTTKKAAGRRVGYGIRIRKRTRKIESMQRKRQECPFCKGNVNREAKGLWKCKKCGKKFAAGAYYIE